MTLDTALADTMVLVDAIADEKMRKLETDLLVSELDLDVEEVDDVLAHAIALWTVERGVLADRLRAMLAQTVTQHGVDDAGCA